MKMPARALLLALFLLASAGSEATAQADVARNPETFRCENGQRIGGTDCTAEGYLLNVLAEEGIDSALAALDALVAVDEDIARDAHGYAHAIGINAYGGDEPVSSVFSRCTPAYQSGCYHGVIQAFFSRHEQAAGGGPTGDMVNALCREYRENLEARWLLFQCAHGMGHGLVALADKHLPTSLQGCDLVEYAWEREACYGGVFMENIVHATTPNEAVGRPEDMASHDHSGDGHHAHAGHTMPAATAAPSEFPPLKADDPLYPCNVLEERYLISCYQMQTSAILYFNDYDIAAASRACAAAPRDYQPTCYQSLGRDISSLSAQDHRKAMSDCGTAPDEFEPWCHVGYTKNLVDLTADPNDGAAYCRLLPSGESKRSCYIAIGEQIWVLADSPERRSSLCAAVESDYIAVCRLGAGLSEETALLDSSARRPTD